MSGFVWVVLFVLSEPGTTAKTYVRATPTFDSRSECEFRATVLAVERHQQGLQTEFYCYAKITQQK